MIIGYCSVSRLEPRAHLERQKERLAAIGAQQLYTEQTGRRWPELERAIESARAGDVIAATKPYRIATSQRGILALIDRLARKGIGLKILDTPVDTSTTTGRMVLGSAPLYSLGMSPLFSLLRDLGLGRLRG